MASLYQLSKHVTNIKIFLFPSVAVSSFCTTFGNEIRAAVKTNKVRLSAFRAPIVAIISSGQRTQEPTMKGNQGLEALAALCGGQSDAPTEDGRNVNRLGNQSSNSAALTAALTSALSSSSQQSQSNQDSQRQQGMGTLSNQQTNLQNVTPQQWQQAIAAATALQGGGVNPTLAAQTLLLSAGLPSQQHLNDNSLATMKQLAYQQYVQARANMTAQQAAQALSNGGGQGGFNESQQALIMALAGGKGNPFSGVHGTFRFLLDW